MPRLLIVLLNLVGTSVPAVRTSLAFCVLDTDLIRGTKLGAGVIPRPCITLLAEEALCTVGMAVAMDANLVALALTVNAITTLALKTA